MRVRWGEGKQARVDPKRGGKGPHELGLNTVTVDLNVKTLSRHLVPQRFTFQVDAQKLAAVHTRILGDPKRGGGHLRAPRVKP
eukprot:1673570-Pyramimonas_sp.AAC.1